MKNLKKLLHVKRAMNYWRINVFSYAKSLRFYIEVIALLLTRYALFTSISLKKKTIVTRLNVLTNFMWISQDKTAIRLSVVPTRSKRMMESLANA